MSEKKPSLFDYFLEEIENEGLSESESLNNDKYIENSLRLNENSIANKETNLDESNCYDMLKAFDDAFDTIYGDSNVNFIQIQQLSEELQTNCMHLINMVKNKKNSTEIELLRSRNTLPENDSQTTINQLKCQITELNLQLEGQSKFSSIIGSTLGFYLWKATQKPAIIDIVLQENKVKVFAKLMVSVLTDFIKTYNNKIPSIKTYETKFVLSMLGIVANVTTTKEGCRFFSLVDDGANVIHLIVSLVLCTHISQENHLKKIAYAALYNVSIQFNGHLLMENNELIKALYTEIKILPHNNKDINDTLLYALKLLHSLTLNINGSMYNILKNEINLQDILKLTRYPETELTARKIYENISVANEKYKDEFEEL